MLVWLMKLLSQHFHFFHALGVFQYLTLRTICSALTALLIALLLGPYLIHRLSSHQVGQVIRKLGPQSHFSKEGTPTMGGSLILIAITISTLLWAELTNRYVWIVLGVMLGFGAIGWIDDYRKLILKNSRGLSARWKFFWQSVIALILGVYLYATAHTSAETQLIFPFFKNILIPLGPFFIVVAYFVVVGSSNAVNLTDGLDGLAILPTVMIGCGLGVFAYLIGNIQFAKYLLVPYIPKVGELVIICGAIAGSGLGFLWFNAYPAMIFMGDVGALGLGAALGTIAILVRQELVFAFMAGLFVLETISVILQVGSYKLTGKRVFKMAPLHHHFELKGWPEPRVIVRFWIITFVLVLLGLATLKLR